MKSYSKPGAGSGYISCSLIATSGVPAMMPSPSTVLTAMLMQFSFRASAILAATALVMTPGAS